MSVRRVIIVGIGVKQAVCGVIGLGRVVRGVLTANFAPGFEQLIGMNLAPHSSSATGLERLRSNGFEEAS